MMDQSDDHSHKRIIGSRAAIIRAVATAFFDALPEHTLWRIDTAMLDAIADAAQLDGARGQRRAWVMDALWGDPTLVHRYRRAEMDDQARRVRGVQRASAVQVSATDDVVCCSSCRLPAGPAEQRILVADLCELPEHRVTPQLLAAVAVHLAMWTAHVTEAQHSVVAAYYGLHGVAPHDTVVQARRGKQAESSVRNILQRGRTVLRQHVTATIGDLVTQATTMDVPFDDPAFWERVERTPMCWNWTGALDRGYGVLKRNGRKQQARRYAWKLLYGPIPRGKQLACTCLNRSCVRIDHMEVIDPGELQQHERMGE